MSSSSDPAFKPPPAVECICRERCLGFGKKVHAPDKICQECLKRQDPQQLRIWAEGNSSALTIIDEEVSQKQRMKENVETHGRYLCAFEDPDYQDCRWRRRDLNLRGTRLGCSVVKSKGLACEKCWRRHLERIGVVQYFTPAGMCHEEADKPGQSTCASTEGDDEDDVEGYNIVLS